MGKGNKKNRSQRQQGVASQHAATRSTAGRQTGAQKPQPEGIQGLLKAQQQVQVELVSVGQEIDQAQAEAGATVDEKVAAFREKLIASLQPKMEKKHGALLQRRNELQQRRQTLTLQIQSAMTAQYLIDNGFSMGAAAEVDDVEMIGDLASDLEAELLGEFEEDDDTVIDMAEELAKVGAGLTEMAEEMDATPEVDEVDEAIEELDVDQLEEAE